ncbi:nitric oxide-sensing protein NosP [Vibrio nigripulchritudo]|uniref:nitric oxide-sensing protein NosP n=1 Tax=Vibrio nigripulchritudo TaxID=28173 RepID=UPI0005F9D3FF|nr:nitric oxide-sensing protein NosP [Vibrio nigripulchritudo]KJY79839.1 GfdT protein [Vibrio nigripulchritudo]
MFSANPLSEQTSVVTAESYQLDAVKAVRELASRLNDPNIGFVLFFCSAAYDLRELETEMHRAFTHCKVMGCTTAGEITSSGYAKSSISAIGFAKDAFTVSGMVIPLEGFELNVAQRCVENLFDGCRSQLRAPIKHSSFVLTLIDGLSPQEENFLVTLDTALGRIPHFGGSAGDDENLANTHVYCDGKFYTSSAIVVMFNTTCPFEVFTTHHINSLGSKLVVTKADSECRRVYEFNAEPAAKVYAREVGIELADLRPEIYALHPLAVKVGGDYYIRSIQKVNEDLSLDFYCAVDDGIVITAMKPGDIYANVKEKLNEVSERIGDLEIIIGCDCFLRRKEIEQSNGLETIREIFSAFRMVGFNTYGEQLGGVHMNQTLTGVAIGRQKNVYPISSDELLKRDKAS